MSSDNHPSVLNELHYRMEELPRALSRIARYILTNPEKVIRQSLSELAQNSQSGQASVVRLVNELGFDGFSDFKIQLTTELARLPTLVNAKGNPVSVVAESVSQGAIADLEATAQLMIDGPIAVVVDRLRRCRRVDIFGTGISGLAGEVLNYRLLRVGINSQAFRDPTLAHELAGRLDAECVAIAISDSGTTPITVEFLRTARNESAFTVAISCRASSALADYADALIQTGSPAGADRAGCIMGVLARATCVTEALGQLLELEQASSN